MLWLLFMFCGCSWLSLSLIWCFCFWYLMFSLRLHYGKCYYDTICLKFIFMFFCHCLWFWSVCRFVRPSVHHTTNSQPDFFACKINKQWIFVAAQQNSLLYHAKLMMAQHEETANKLNETFLHNRVWKENKHEFYLICCSKRDKVKCWKLSLLLCFFFSVLNNSCRAGTETISFPPI